MFIISSVQQRHTQTLVRWCNHWAMEETRDELGHLLGTFMIHMSLKNQAYDL